MTRQINALAYETYDDLLSQLPRAIKTEEINQINRTVRIELSDAVILKVYQNELIIDLGGKFFSFKPYEFDSITIR